MLVSGRVNVHSIANFCFCLADSKIRCNFGGYRIDEQNPEPARVVETLNIYGIFVIDNETIDDI